MPRRARRRGNQHVAETLPRWHQGFETAVHNPRPPSAKQTLEAVTGERIAALEAVEPDKAKEREAGFDAGRSGSREDGASASQERERSSGPAMEQNRALKGLDRDLRL